MAEKKRTIPQGTLNIQAFVYDLLEAFPAKYSDLKEFFDDGSTDNFVIDVDPSWDGADDLALDALIAAHVLGDPPFIDGEDLYITHVMPAPVATNSTTFQPAFSFSFSADPDWTLEMKFMYHYSIGNKNQQAEIEFRFNGIPIVTSRVNADPGALEPVGGTFPLNSLLLQANTLDIYIKKVSGVSLVTLQDLLISTEIVNTGL